MLVNLKEILSETRKKKYAVPQFNCVTLEMTMGILQAAEEARSPVILGPAEILLPNAGPEEYVGMMRALAEKASVPVALHFDHIFNEKLAKDALTLGFSSVMYDCSTLSFEENAKKVKEMSEFAHGLNCSVEGELGHVGTNYNQSDVSTKELYTSPDDAARFASQTGCDALAVAIGTAHGVYTVKPVLDIKRLAQIAAATDVPLVLHGGSGLSDEDFKAVVQNGISKINIYTDLNLAAGQAAHSFYKDGMGAYELMPFICEAVKQAALKKIALFGSASMA